MTRNPKTFALAAAAAMILLSGCEAGVTTRVDVESATESHISATIRFTEEAAQQLVESPELDQQLQDLIENRTGKAPEREGGPEELSYTVELTYEEMTGAKDVLGIDAANIEGRDEDDVTLTLHLAAPSGLNDAIVRATSTQTDGAALAETMLKRTTVTVQVGFEGGITDVTWPGEVDRQEDVVTVEQSLATFQTGDLVVQGDPQESFLAAYGLPLGIGAGLLVLLGLVLQYRRRSLADHE